MKKTILVLLVLVLQIYSIDSFSQIHSIPWNPSIISSAQKAYLDLCEKFYYDTLGNQVGPSDSFDSRRVWLDGNYFEYIEIDSLNQKVSWKFRKSTDAEIAQRKKIILDQRNIHSLIGTQFPDLEFVDLNGNKYSTSQFKNKVVYLNFWFVGCQPCELERQKLNKIYKKYQDNEDVIFLSLSKSNEKKTQKHLIKKQVLWPVVIFNKDLRNSISYIESYPTNIILYNQKYDTALAGLSEGAFLVIDERLELLTQ